MDGVLAVHFVYVSSQIKSLSIRTFTFFTFVGVSINYEAEFSGEGSYVELPKQLLPHSRESGGEEIIKLTVTTDLEDALVFWQGQTPTISGRGKDYIAIAIQNGYPVFR